MQQIFKKIDELAGIDRSNKPLALWLERLAFVFLCLMILFAPHSIAASQTGWVVGTLFWFARLLIKPRPKFFRTALDIPFLAFFGWTVITSIFSYAPDISLNKLPGVIIFLIFFFVVNNVRNLRTVKFLAGALIFSCMVNVLWTPVERIFGRGVEIQGISETSPLKKALLWEGDTLLKVNDKKIRTPEEIVAEIEKSESNKVFFYRPDFYFSVEVMRNDLLPGSNALERLGIQSWKKSHNWRSQGFYGHYTTYAEVLQLIISLVFGLFVAAAGSFLKEKGKRKKEKERTEIQKPKSKILIILLLCLSGMAFALLLTVTRGSQLAFMISAFCIVLFYGNRKLLLVLAAVALPVAIGGVIFLNQTREVGFFDRTDTSVTYRETVYREGLDLWTKNPRNFFLGIGMDSVKRFAKEWRLFDDGKLNIGHYHSTPIQLLVERGLPALLLWLWIFGIYIRTLWRGLNPKSQIPNPKSNDFVLKGILLGTLGGAIGFFASGLFHYNLGDQEVAMVFYILMGLSVFICKFGESVESVESVESRVI